jgi:peptide deformylase
MSLLQVRHFPDPILKKVCEPVHEIDDGLRMFLVDMAETMIAQKGVGLAAPQVGRSQRFFVVDIWWPSDQDDKTLIFINPKITAYEGSQRGLEGCLSIPGVFEHVTRAQKIRVVAQDINSQVFELDAEGFLAVAIQHEFDHLNGVLTFDRLGPLARKMATKKYDQASEARARDRKGGPQLSVAKRP